MFTERSSSTYEPVIIGDTNKMPFRSTPLPGDTVFLKIGPETVIINLLDLSGHIYRGKITGFEPSLEVQFQGLTLGQIVEFNEKHIHGFNIH